MNRNQFLALVLAGCWFLSPLPGGLHAQQRIQDVAKQLNLSPQQKAQLAPVLMQEAPKLKAIKADTSLSPVQKLQQLRAIRAQNDPKVKSILSPDQYQKLQEIRRQEMQSMMQNMRNRQGN